MMNFGLPVTYFQYAYMTHFFANPLSVFLCKRLRFEDLSKEHLDALRNLPSFRQYVDPRHYNAGRFANLSKACGSVFSFRRRLGSRTVLARLRPCAFRLCHEKAR